MHVSAHVAFQLAALRQRTELRILTFSISPPQMAHAKKAMHRMHYQNVRERHAAGCGTKDYIPRGKPKAYWGLGLWL